MKNLILTGGGSAGHVVPNLALIPELKSRFNLFYIGTDGIERELLKGSGIPFYTISCAKLVRGSIVQNLLLPARFVKSVRAAKQALVSAKADAVFSKGGYVALPVVFAAKKLKIPVVSHESDLSAGIANKLIAKRCKLVLTSFPETAKTLKNGVYSGSPVRRELFTGDRESALAKYGFSGRKPVLLVFGGGSGSLAINRALEAALPRLLDDFDILHICGKNEGEKKRAGYLPLEYEKDMASAYAAADFVLSRAGSNTVFELLALKKPALLVPLENKRSRGDQIENAAYFEKRGLCRVLREPNLSAAALSSELERLQKDISLRRSLAAADFRPGNGTIVSAVCEAAGV